MQTCYKDWTYKPKQHFSLSAIKHPMPTTIEPTIYKQALNQSHWKHAMDEEYTAPERNRT